MKTSAAKKARSKTHTKNGFHDRIAVFTAPSGTQYVRAIDLILDEDWAKLEPISEIIKAEQAKERRKKP